MRVICGRCFGMGVVEAGSAESVCPDCLGIGEPDDAHRQEERHEVLVAGLDGAMCNDEAREVFRLMCQIHHPDVSEVAIRCGGKLDEMRYWGLGADAPHVKIIRRETP